MTVNNLASQIAKLEGKKSQARIGDIREILKHLIQLEFDAVTDKSVPNTEWPSFVLAIQVNKKLRKVKQK